MAQKEFSVAVDHAPLFLRPNSVPLRCGQTNW